MVFFYHESRCHGSSIAIQDRARTDEDGEREGRSSVIVVLIGKKCCTTTKTTNSPRSPLIPRRLQPGNQVINLRPFALTKDRLGCTRWTQNLQLQIDGTAKNRGKQIQYIEPERIQGTIARQSEAGLAEEQIFQ